jgi:hypothetical protein
MRAKDTSKVSRGLLCGSADQDGNTRRIEFLLSGPKFQVPGLAAADSVTRYVLRSSMNSTPWNAHLG